MNQKEKNSVIQQLTRKEESRLVYFLKQWIPNKEDAKDIAQDVFYNLVLGFEEIKDIDKMTSWLYSTARFKAIDFLRKKKPTLASDMNRSHDTNEQESDIFEWLQDYIPPQQEIAMWQEEVYEVLANALARLPVAQRDAFVLHEMEGVPMAEIARQEQVSVNTILSRKRYAVTALKKELQLLYNELND
ncbi:RNA polymerase sigma factor [Zhouia amylolytica]|uniref:RNA polymerase sigma factor n=1 Tax=Zhouia amylolytica TaxID=376730 RepID=UPI0020CD9839|nr:RNA polymerase sigma factor [Zhouia amylolytica]MCQ0111040.1 RNA polymerase sigma factor [Zhouia amylolytica]